MYEVVIQTAEPTSTQEATEWMIKIINGTYAKEDLKQVVDNITCLDDEEINMLLGLLEGFEDFFDGTLVYWATEIVKLELEPGSKTFNSRYYPVPKTNKETFCKELKRIVEIGVPTLVQQSQYDTPVFIIPKKEETVRFITDYCRLNR